MKKKILLSLMVVLGLFTITGCGNKEETKIILNNNLEFEINSEIDLPDIIKSIDKGTLIDDKEKIDSSALGSKEITFKYKNNLEEEKEYSLKIKIIDTTKPEIESPKELTTIIGSNINLLENVVVKDNSNEEIIATVEGEYDINKEGTYNLKYVATDSSGNEISKDFSLVVKSINLKKGFYEAKNKGKYNTVTIKDNFISISYNVGGDELGGHGGYVQYGTYKITGNKLIATLTHYYNLGPDIDGTRLSNSETLEFTIISDTELKIDNQTFKH